jgi:hypothetical protein
LLFERVLLFKLWKDAIFPASQAKALAYARATAFWGGRMVQQGLLRAVITTVWHQRDEPGLGSGLRQAQDFAQGRALIVGTEQPARL